MNPRVAAPSTKASTTPAGATSRWKAFALRAGFALTMFLSAWLLFSVQPMIGKMVLPFFGGTSSVWIACMVFFQASLLAGYCYAHLCTTWLRPRRQLVVHAVLLLLPLAVLPIAASQLPLSFHGVGPLVQLIALLFLSAAIPFFAVSTTAPLLQRWFAWSDDASAQDPYFLYGASNFGSLIALLSYPSLIEPNLHLATQSRIWAAGYVVFVAMMACCAAMVFWSRTSSVGPLASARVASATLENSGRLTLARRARWVALALVPSSLMLGATSYITTDLASIPLLWMIPLALYLTSFIIVFSWTAERLHRAMIFLLPPLLLVVVFLMTTVVLATWWRLWMTIAVHLALLFVVALVCHGELARSRPPAAQLTEYYLWISFGGVLGGLCNVVIAPLIFNSVTEYPLAMIGASLLLPVTAANVSRRTRRLDLALPLALGLLTAILWSGAVEITLSADNLAQMLHVDRSALSTLGDSVFRFDPARVNAFLRVGTPVVLCYLLADRPLRFGLGIAILFLAPALFGKSEADILFHDRSFYGVLTVENRDSMHRLVHGTTLHGMQSLDPAERFEPLTYYHRTGPIGQVFDALRGASTLDRVAVVGLGTGSMAAYGGPGRTITFLEIDPAVVRIAEDPAYFTYLQDCRERGGKCDVTLGDARLKLSEMPAGSFGLIVVDAFSSDSIPIHLLTAECLQIYCDKLEPGGLVAFHISNRHLDLAPILGNLADKAGLVNLAQQDDAVEDDGKLESHWVVLARRREDLGALADDPRWQELAWRPDVGVWTDDYSDLLGVFRWN